MTRKISEMDALGVLADDDQIEIVDKSDTTDAVTGSNKYLTIPVLVTKLSLDGFTKTTEVLTLINTTSYTPTLDYHPMTLKHFLDNCLSKTNTTAFSPTADYHPATKKYVDDNLNIQPFSQIITTSQTLTKPTGANLVSIIAYGAGGGGSRVGSSGGNSTDGGDTTVIFGGYTVTAGGGGKANTQSNVPGAGGIATGGYINYDGGAGGDGDDGPSDTGGSGGTNIAGHVDGTVTPGDYLYGEGGYGGGNSQDGGDATAYASGGGGGDATIQGGGGGGGAMSIYWGVADDLDIVIGAAGVGGSGLQAGGDGSQGVIEVTWS